MDTAANACAGRHQGVAAAEIIGMAKTACSALRWSPSGRNWIRRPKRCRQHVCRKSPARPLSDVDRADPLDFVRRSRWRALPLCRPFSFAFRGLAHARAVGGALLPAEGPIRSSTANVLLTTGTRSTDSDRALVRTWDCIRRPHTGRTGRSPECAEQRSSKWREFPGDYLSDLS